MKRRVEGRSFSSASLRARAGLLLACAALSVFALSCGGETGTKDFDAEADASVKKGVKPEPDAEAAVLETTFGRIVIELYPNVAPKMVERFKTLAKEGFYNGTAFHRVNPQAGVVQGGDPNSKDDNPSNDGMGGSPLPDLPSEFSDIPFERGVVGAARSTDPNSANSQFYITLRRVPQWDGQYTVFGRVIEGMSNADVIAGAPTRPGTENPADKIILQSVTFQPRANFVR